jgi:putative ABC transport system permease protein
VSSFLVALRRLREDRIPALAIAAVILVTATVFAVAPRVLERVGDDALQATVRNASPFERNVTIVQEQAIFPGPPDDPLAEVESTGDALTATMPTGVQMLFASRSTVVDSNRWHLETETPDPTFVRFRVQPGAEARIHYVQGRAPTGATSTVDLPPPTEPAPGEPLQQTANVLEVAISVDAVRSTGHGLGDTILLTPDPRDPLTGPLRSGLAALRIVGLFAVDDPADPFWDGDHALERVSYRTLGGDSLLVDVTGLIATAAYEPMLRLIDNDMTPARTSWRSFVDPGRLRAANLDPLVRDLRRLEATFPRIQASATRALDAPALQSGLLPLVEAHVARWASATAILTVLALGPATVALGTLLLIAAIAARRRRPALVLVRGRGASVGQTVRAVLLESALLAIPATALAIAIAATAVASDQIRPTIVGAAIVAVAAIVLLVATGIAGTSVGAAARAADVPANRSARRIVFEIAVIGAAAIGSGLLRERGIRGASSTGTLSAADPLIAAVPALAGFAVGLAIVRLLPVPLRWLSRLAATRRGLIGLLAFRRASGGGTTGPLVVVLLVVASIGTFASTTLIHVDRAGATSSWQTVGAPFRIVSSAGSLPRALDPAALPGVRSFATVFQALVAFGPSRIRVQLDAVDAPGYVALVGGSLADPDLPPEMLGPAPDVLPVVVSTSLATRPDGVKLGSEFHIAVDAYDVPVRVVAVRDAVAGLPATGVFAVISRTQLREREPDLTLAPSIVFLDAPPDAGPALRDAVAVVTPAARVDDRAALELGFTNSPVTAAILAGVIVSALVAAAYAALAVSTALAMAGAARAGETAKLRTLGLSARQAMAVTVIEHGPTVIVGFVAGVGLGLGLFAALEPGLGLDALVGSRVDVPLTADPAQLGLICVGVVAIAAIGIGLAAWLQGRVGPLTVLRRGVE